MPDTPPNSEPSPKEPEKYRSYISQYSSYANLYFIHRKTNHRLIAGLSFENWQKRDSDFIWKVENALTQITWSTDQLITKIITDNSQGTIEFKFQTSYDVIFEHKKWRR